MLVGLAVAVGLIMTLGLPIYPQTLTPQIVAFGAICGVAATLAWGRASARLEMVHMLPWALAVVLAGAVGALQGCSTRQAMEDALPFAMFAFGLVAGRGAPHPERILGVLLWICVADAAISLMRMPAFVPGIRSTYSYFKITAGLPLVGIYASSWLWNQSTATLRRVVLVFGVAIMAVAIVATVSRGMILAALIGLSTSLCLRRRSVLLLGIWILAIAGTIVSSEALELVGSHLRLDQSATVEGRVREIDRALVAFSEHPVFGSGLGCELEVDGASVTFVHNIVAYHGWKFGLVGSVFLLLPLLRLLGITIRMPHLARSSALGFAAAVFVYLVTSAAYKTYYLVWIYGVATGLTLTWVKTSAWRSSRE